ncbi:MAG TPA: serine hydrolase domain-containing protein [Longimicrobiales bacterium]|nr:serine hydrolase domain-containing protein [Longimicrobiales bacterium]
MNARIPVRASFPLWVAVLVHVWAAAPTAGQTNPHGVAVLERTDPAAVGMSAERLARLGPVLQRYVDDGRLAGGVVLVARHGRVVYVEPFGRMDVERDVAMRADAMFRIASQTKALVSVAIMMLQEEGELALSNPVGWFLPEYASTTVAVAREGGGYDVVPAARPITIRDLLTHTAGIGYGGGTAQDRWREADITGWYFAHRDEPVAETVARMAGLPFDAQPGERFVYGYATDILGVVVERVSGLSLDDFLRTRILEPLRMHDTHFFLPPDERDRLATVYSAGEDGTIRRAPDAGTMQSQGAYVEGPRRSFSGGAGLVSTAADYGRFLQMLLNGGELEGVRLLSPASVTLMTADHLGDRYPTAGVGFGLGFSVVRDLGRRGTPGSVGEFGWGGAYHSTYWVDPQEQLVVVYLTQLLPAGPIDDFARLRAVVYSAILSRN